jgi:hypothetical protein
MTIDSESMIDAPEPQCADAVLMVRPAGFDYNLQTAASNPMQHRTQPRDGHVQALARAEFDGVVAALRAERIRVCAAEDTPRPPKPDAVFPNNWVSFHGDGTVVIYPLEAENRRRERRRELIEQAARELGFRVRRILDLTHHEHAGRFLEGTGSLALDRAHRVAYACRSPRTDAAVLEEWSRELRYEPVSFRAEDERGRAIYHTNVMMCIGARLAIVCAESIVPADRERVLERLAGSGREIIEIDRSAVRSFAANALELASPSAGSGGAGVLVVSATARSALGSRALARLARLTGKVVTVSVPTIEKLGGGGVRCMLAEVFSSP